MFLVALLVVSLVLGMLPRRWLTLLLPPSGPGPSIGDVCVACGSTSVTLLAPLVYRCNTCGHEGGDGWGSRERARRDAAFKTWSPARRRRSGRRDLREARTLLLTGLGELERALDIGDSLFEDTRRVGSSERGQRLASATGYLLEARDKARDAEAKLGISLGAAASADLCEGTSDEYLTMPDELRRLRREGKVMLLAVEAALRSLRPTEPRSPAPRKDPRATA